MSAKLLQRLAARRGSSDPIAYADDCSTSSSRSNDSKPAETDTQSYCAAIRKMGLPIMSPNQTVRQRKDEENRLGTAADRAVTAQQSHETRRDGAASNDSQDHIAAIGCRDTNGKTRRSRTTNFSLAPRGRRRRASTVSPPTGRSKAHTTSPTRRGLAGATAASSRRYHTPERLRTGFAPAEAFEGPEQWKELTNWLGELKYMRYAGLFRRSGISSLRALQMTSIADLSDIGIAGNHLPVFQLRINELRRKADSLSKSHRSTGGNSSSDSSSPDEDGNADPFWEKVSSYVSGNRHVGVSSTPTLAKEKTRYGSPSRMSSTAAAVRAGIPHNFFDSHCNVRVPSTAIRSPRVERGNNVLINTNANGPPTKYRGRQRNMELSHSRGLSSEKLGSLSSSYKYTYHSPEYLRPQKGVSVEDEPDPRQDLDEWQQIRDWLASLKLSRYEGLFVRSGITKIKFVKALTIHDLAKIGVSDSKIYPILLRTAKSLVIPNLHDTKSKNTRSTLAGQQAVSIGPESPKASHKGSLFEHAFFSYQDGCDFSRSDPVRSYSDPSGSQGPSDRSLSQLSLHERLFQSGDSHFSDNYRSKKDKSFAPSISDSMPAYPIDVNTEKIALQMPQPQINSGFMKLLQAFYQGDFILFYTLWDCIMCDVTRREDNSTGMIHAGDLLELFTRVYFVIWSQSIPGHERADDILRAKAQFRSYIDHVSADPHRYSALLSSSEFAAFVGIGILPDTISNTSYAPLFRAEWAKGLGDRLVKFVSCVINTSHSTSVLNTNDWDANAVKYSPFGIHDINAEYVLGGESMYGDENLNHVKDVEEPISVSDLESSVYKLDGHLYTIDVPADLFSLRVSGGVKGPIADTAVEVSESIYADSCGGVEDTMLTQSSLNDKTGRMVEVDKITHKIKPLSTNELSAPKIEVPDNSLDERAVEVALINSSASAFVCVGSAHSSRPNSTPMVHSKGNDLGKQEKFDHGNVADTDIKTDDGTNKVSGVLMLDID